MPATTQVPSLHRRHTRRPRLTRLLEASTAQAIIVNAPAGYGKTSLVCEWLEGSPEVAWYRTTAASADLAAFSVGIADAVGPLLPGTGDRLRQRVGVGDAPDQSVRPLAELLAEDLASWPKDSWLVIDDYHLVIDSAPVEEFMDWLLTLAPIRVIVTTRRRPSWATARRLLYDEALEVTSEQLAMSPEEAAEVLTDRSAADVQAIVSQTQGWPVLIGLAALSGSLEIPNERVSEELFRYLAEEVFRGEPPEVRTFMLVSSLPQTLSATITRDVLGVERPEEAIERLLGEGLLRDADHGELAFHPLLREFLRRKLELEHPDLAGQLADKVFANARDTQRWVEAFDIALYRRRPDQGADIIGAAAPALLTAGRFELVEKWLDRCGSAVAGCPSALLARSELLLRRGLVSDAASLALSVAHGLGDDDPYASKAWCLAGRSMHLLSEEERALAYHKRALATAVTRSDRTESLWGAFLAAVELELDEAADLLAEFRERSADDVESRLRVAVGVSLLAERKTTLAEASESVREALALVDYARDPLVKTGLLSAAAYVAYLQANYREGVRILNRADSVCRDMRITFAENYSRSIRAYLQIALRQFRTAQSTISTLNAIALRTDDAYLDFLVAVLSLKLALSRGAIGSAGLLLRAESDSRIVKDVRGELLALQALAAASSGQTALARERVRLARVITKGIETAFLSRFAELVCDINADSEDRLVDLANDLLEDCKAGEIFDPIVTAYRACPPLLKLLVRGCPRHLELLKAVATSANDARLASGAGLRLDQVRRRSPRSPLTAREEEVLSLLSDALSNREIARALYVEESTVKAHVHSILKKLGVKSRLQATLLAREFQVSPEA